MTAFLKNAFLYVVQKVLLIDLVLAALTAMSFVFTRRFSAVAYSERIFWVSVAIFLIGGTIAFANLLGGGGSRSLMFPFNIRKPEDAKKFMDQAPAMREQTEQRLDVGIQLWLIGLGCLAISALVQMVFG